MKTYQPIGTTSVQAQDAIGKNLFIGFDGNLPSASAKPLGVTDAKADQYEQVPVVMAGIALVLSGASFSQGAALVTNASGKAIAGTTLSAQTPAGGTTMLSTSPQPGMTIAGCVLPQVIAGYALDTATGADQLIRILLN